MTDLEAMAASLYAEGAGERGPAWSQLGGVTRSVWLERAQIVLDELEGMA
jgi:hypothetical protein